MYLIKLKQEISFEFPLLSFFRILQRETLRIRKEQEKKMMILLTW